MPLCTLHSLLAQKLGVHKASGLISFFEACIRPCIKTEDDPVDQGCMLGGAGVHRTQAGPHSVIPSVCKGLSAVDRCHLPPKIGNALMNSGGLTKHFFAAAVMFSSCPC